MEEEKITPNEGENMTAEEVLSGIEDGEKSLDEIVEEETKESDDDED